MQKTKAPEASVYVLRLELKKPGQPYPGLDVMPQDPAVKFSFGPPARLTVRIVNRQFAVVPATTRQALLALTEEALIARRAELVKKYREHRTSQDAAAFLEQGTLHYLHGCFRAFRDASAGLRVLHGMPVDGNRVRLQAARFPAGAPTLHFRVEQTGAGLQLCAFVKTDEGSTPLESWSRHYFLLAKESTFLVLSTKDYQTLEWLQAVRPEQWAQDGAQLSEQVLDVLDRNYTVDRNGCFEENIIDEEPEHHVQLSELNGRYLVFTPAWRYGGIEVDGVWTPELRRKAGGTEWTIRRRKATEEAFVARLRALHPNFDGQLNGYFYLSFEEAQKKQWFLNAFYKLLEQEVTITGLSMLTHFRCSEYKPVTETELLSAPGDPQVRLRFALQFGKEKVPLPVLQKAIFAGQGIVLLRDGSMGVLPTEWFDTWATLIRHARIEKDVFTVPRWLALTGSSDSAETTVLKPVINPAWWQQWQRWQKGTDILYPVPALVQATLRPYQQKGYEWLQLLLEAGASACLADDMGLGKTLQTITFICRQLEADPGRQHLIVCPASLVYNWKQEWERFAPSVRIGLFTKPEDEAGTAPQVLIATYHSVRGHVERLSETVFATIVLDESHQVKNPAAQITRAVGELKGSYRIAISGTPVMNNTFDLYAQLNFLLPGLFGSREFFRQQYADAIDRRGETDKIEALRRLTAPFLLRRTKSQVATDLPEKTEQVLWCTMKPEQRMAYESIRDKVRANVLMEIEEKGVEQGKMAVLAGITRLKQLCCSAELVRDEDVFTTESIKTQLLLEELTQLVPEHKVLVFSQYSGMLDLLEKALSRERIATLRLDGSTPVAERQELCNRFNDAGAPERVFLLSLKAGNAGLNLMAADYVFLFDIWWNRAVEQQAIDRTHRIGQTRPVFAYRMICTDSIEEKIYQLQQRKATISEELIQAEEGFVKSLTLDDVKFLLD
ncbi:DEAD/DEAH box helicase [Flaviaesturariibacter amylovorans]|uniref:DEAD/DEAH box helicase n=1 Tax=Flaviaesturariibacter amylovorans TaxID=1084520 RepID=A0ABP8GMW4_9BACT